MLLSIGPVIGREHLPLDKLSPTTASPTPPPRAENTQKMSVPTERDKIITALNACAGNQSRAAKLLGMPRRTFVNKLDAYQIPRPKKTQSTDPDDDTTSDPDDTPN